MEVWVKKVASEPIGQRYCVTEATFTYVAVDPEGRARPVPKTDNPEYELAMSGIQA
ncbi:MAG: hypothetical protein ACRC9E_14830, partial [Plesiomonas shigelloides]